MIQAATIDGGAPRSPALDWDGLVAEGRELLGAMSDGRWTDFNAHDPGITMLELFSYALNDLAYRAEHPIADLLAGTAPPAGPDALLAGRAVTRADLRRVALAAPGVRNAWIEPSDHPTLRLRHAAAARELRFDAAAEQAGDPIKLQGVYRVLIEKSSREDLPAAEIARGVAAALHRHRGLGEDFDAVDVLAPLPVAVAVELEIADPARGDAVLLALYAALADYCSPPPAWRDAASLRAGGWTTEAIHDGPPTGGARLDDGGAAPPRRVALQLSDVIAAVSGIDGVRAVRRVRIGVAGDDLSGAARWSLPIPSDRVARFDPRASRILLVAGGGFALDSAAREDLADLFAERVGEAGGPVASAETAVPAARDRRVAEYRPLRLDLPAVYGVAPGALVEAGPERQAQAAQLRAYLAILDALLANQFAQLAGAGALLGSAAAASYFTQITEPAATLRDEWPIHADGFTAASLQALVEPPGAAAGVDRRNRLLAHLLARVGEEAPSALPPPGLATETPRALPLSTDVPAAERVLDSRARFLADFARLSAGRGAGADLLDPKDEPPLIDRIRLKFGLSEAEGARLRLVEHILLRPFADDGQAQALLAAAAGPDPYSLQLSLVADAVLEPAAASLARVARAETPAHLVLHVRWLDAAAFDAFADSYAHWRRTLAAQRREALGFGGKA